MNATSKDINRRVLLGSHIFEGIREGTAIVVELSPKGNVCVKYEDYRGNKWYHPDAFKYLFAEWLTPPLLS